jgi:hypothetical protein
VGALAQLGERLICIQEVIGSIPIGSTICAQRRVGTQAPAPDGIGDGIGDRIGKPARQVCPSGWTKTYDIDIVERENISIADVPA